MFWECSIIKLEIYNKKYYKCEIKKYLSNQWVKEGNKVF